MTTRPFRTAIIFASGYILFCSTYIWLSGSIAVKMAQSLPNLHSIELIKGLTFVFVTGIVLFALIYGLMFRIRAQNRELDSQRKALVQSRAQALSGTFAAGIAHDINNVLAIIDFNICELQSVVPHGQKEYVESIYKAYTLIRDMARRLQRIGKTCTEADMRETDVGQLVNHTISFAQHHRKLKTCSIQLVQNSSRTLKINPIFLEQMIINLMLNAADATGSKGKIEVRVENRDEQVCIEVHDDGPGISEDLKGRLFQPFYTTKTDGTGLGLLTVKTCAKLHGGSVEIDKSALGGALFRIVLPGS